MDSTLILFSVNKFCGNQVRVLLDKADGVSKLWDNAPIVICGDFNSTPKVGSIIPIEALMTCFSISAYFLLLLTCENVML